jgi:hypothetical protein
MALIYVLEEHNPWQGDSPVTEVLTKLEANPFVTFQEMDLNNALKLQPYDRKKALVTLKRGKEPSVELSAKEPFSFKGSINRGDWRNTVLLRMANSQLKKVELPILFNYLKEIAELFPKFLFAEIKPDMQIADYYNENDLEWLPACFGNFLNWYHLLSPLAYAPYYTREELLAVPAHRVRELDNGWIEIISYADPLSYDQPQTRERIIEMTGYLNAHRLDRKKVAAGV